MPKTRSRLTAPLLTALLAGMLALPPSLVVVSPALAQESEDEMPPMPRPRPDRGEEPSANPGDNEAAAAITALTTTPQPVTLSATIAQDGEAIGAGLVWRVFDTTPDPSGDLTLVAKSEDPVAELELAPGEYVVHVAYGRAQISDTMTVAEGSTEKTVSLEAGALRLGAAVAGDIPIAVNLLTFDIFTAGTGADRTLIADNVGPNEIVTLNSGTYNVVSHFGSINAEVSAELRVEAGQLTDATLYHHASQVAFRLVSEPGGEAIADVEWTVTDPAGATLYSELGAFPSTVLSEGDYIVLAKLGDTVFNREFAVAPGDAQEIEVLTEVY
jgi:hypothetical protein